MGGTFIFFYVPFLFLYTTRSERKSWRKSSTAALLTIIIVSTSSPPRNGDRRWRGGAAATTTTLSSSSQERERECCEHLSTPQLRASSPYFVSQRIPQSSPPSLLLIAIYLSPVSYLWTTTSSSPASTMLLMKLTRLQQQHVWCIFTLHS